MNNNNINIIKTKFKVYNSTIKENIKIQRVSEILLKFHQIIQRIFSSKNVQAIKYNLSKYIHKKLKKITKLNKIKKNQIIYT